MPEKLLTPEASQPLPERVRELGDAAFKFRWPKTLVFLSIIRIMFLVDVQLIIGWLAINWLIEAKLVWGGLLSICAICSTLFTNIRLSAEIVELRKAITDLKTRRTISK